MAADTFLAAIAAARAGVWARAWKLAGGHAPYAGVNRARPMIVDVDATPVIAHSGTRATNGPEPGRHLPTSASAVMRHAAAARSKPQQAGARTLVRDHVRQRGRSPLGISLALVTERVRR